MRVIGASVAAEHRGLSPGRAVDAWLDAIGRAEGSARLSVRSMSITESLGSILAEPVWAVRSSPAFPAVAMDGIAVTAADTVDAAIGHPVRLPPSAFEVVDTGNPLPTGRDAVVMCERVRFDGPVAEIEASVPPGQHVRSIGEDIVAGELLLVPGQRLRPIDLAAAAAAGVTNVSVRRRARLTIIPTGDELRPADVALAPGELADTNSLMLEGLAREAGCETNVWPILPDDADRLAEAVQAAAARSDLVLLVAGTSAGRHDHAPEVLGRCGRIVVRGVAMRPGHPAVLGVVGPAAVMACPGYPVSAALAFEELARPLIAALQGAGAPRRPVVSTRLAADVRSKRGARALQRVRVGTVDGHRVALPLRGGASVMTSLVHADALLAIPDGGEVIAAATPVDVELMPGASERGDALLVAGAPELALELLALAFAEAHEGRARVAFCEAAPLEAARLVRDGVCHVAAVGGRVGAVAPRDRQLRRVRLAECDVGLVLTSELLRDRDPRQVLRGRVRVASASHGTPARHVLDDVVRDVERTGVEIIEVRSDAAAVETVAAGYADCAVSTVPAAGRAGFPAHPLGRAALDLVVARGVAERDPLVRALLHTLRSLGFQAALERAGYKPRAGEQVHVRSESGHGVRSVNVLSTSEVFA
jgi:putative molybdopterin biosynthesis protein